MSPGHSYSFATEQDDLPHWCYCIAHNVLVFNTK